MSLSFFHQLIFQTNQHLCLSLPSAILIEIFSSLQLIHLILETMAFSNPSAQYFIQGFLKASSYFTGSFRLYASSRYKSLYHPIWIIIMIYLIFFIWLFVFSLGVLARKKQLSKRFLKIFGFCHLLHSRILFFPIQYFLYSLMTLHDEETSTTEEMFFEKNGWFIGSVIMIIMNNVLSIMKEFMFVQSNKTNNFYDCKMNIYHRITLVYKSITLFLTYENQLNVKETVYVTSVIHFLTSVILLGVLCTKLPFYRFQMMKTTIIFTSIKLSFSFICLLEAFTQDSEVLNGLQLLFVLLPVFVIKINLSLFKKLNERIIKGWYKSPEHAIHFALILEEFASDNPFLFKEKTAIVDPYIFFGAFKPKNVIDLKKFNDNNKEQEFQLQLYEYILEELHNMLNKFPKNTLLLVFMSEFCLEKLANIPKALEFIRKLESFSLSPSMHSSLQHIYMRLNETYCRENLNSESRLELSRYFKTYALTNSLKKTMIQEISKHLDFWHNMQQQTILAKSLMDISEEIDLLFARIQKTFQDNSSSFTRDLTSSLLLYGVYLSNIRQSGFEASKYIRDFQKLYSNFSSKNKLDIASGNTAVVILSLDKIKAGQILDASGSVEVYFISRKLI